ncbi:MAG TPA: hypothetical protein VK783_06215 [Bacteroidia bacterium]|jgi:hypothetical protein|nr:hypothetical protein [Bacteroidia bacterium]
MKRYSKWLVLVLLFLSGNAAFSNASVSNYQVPDTSVSFNSCYSVSQNTPADFPSHGYAMLILRYNDDSKGKIFSLLLSNPGAPCIAKLKPVFDNSKTCSTYSLYFPEKKLRYEAFLYSLPLRSPPAIC